MRQRLSSQQRRAASAAACKRQAESASRGEGGLVGVVSAWGLGLILARYRAKPLDPFGSN